MQQSTGNSPEATVNRQEATVLRQSKSLIESSELTSLNTKLITNCIRVKMYYKYKQSTDNKQEATGKRQEVRGNITKS